MNKTIFWENKPKIELSHIDNKMITLHQKHYKISPFKMHINLFTYPLFSFTFFGLILGLACPVVPIFHRETLAFFKPVTEAKAELRIHSDTRFPAWVDPKKSKINYLNGWR